MRAGDSLHESVHCDRSCVHGEGSHHADHIPFEEGLPSSQSVLLLEAAHHCGVLEFTKSVSLHQSLHVVEGIVEHPIHSSTHSTSNQRHVDGDVVLVTVGGGELLGQLLNESEVEGETGGFSDGGGCLSSLEAFDSVFFEDLDCGAE